MQKSKPTRAADADVPAHEEAGMFILSRMPDCVQSHLTVTRDGCWIWDVLTASGTPRIWVDGRWSSARRHVYTLVYGPIDETVVHLRAACGRQQCVNPAHTQPVTSTAYKLNRAAAGTPTACPRGHLLTAENITLTRRGDLECLPCKRLRNTPHTKK